MLSANMVPLGRQPPPFQFLSSATTPGRPSFLLPTVSTCLTWATRPGLVFSSTEFIFTMAAYVWQMIRSSCLQCAYIRFLLKIHTRGAWVAQSVKRLTSAQVTISLPVSSSPALGSVLTAQSLEPVSDSVSPSLSDSPPFMLCLSLSQK